MCRKTGKKVFASLFISTVLTCFVSEQLFAKGKEKRPELPKEEEGFYYGYGKASTSEEAEFMAKKELIENALTDELKTLKPRASRISVSDDSVNARLQKLSFSKNDKKGLDVSCKLKANKWAESEESFRNNLRASLDANYEVLKSGKSTAEKLDSAVAILNQLSVNGIYDLLSLHEGGDELYSKKVEGMCGTLVDELAFAISTPSGIVNSSTAFSVNVKDRNGKAVKGLSVKISWDPASVPVSFDDAEPVDGIVDIVKTDAEGNAEFSFPESDVMKGRPVTLTVSTAFSASKLATSAMRKFDARSSADENYIFVTEDSEAYKTVMVEAGDFEAGAIDGDRKAGSKEAKHTVTLSAYEMSVSPVTNAQYAAFILATRSEEYPEFMSNPEYNKANQPVIGVSFDDANEYAKWLSEQTGDTYRLPTAEEWEKAARAGEQVIYPWGNDVPSKKKNANYNKNGKFKGPSPVGAYEEGNNAWGLKDMSGNVWEWTSSEFVTEGAEPSEEGVSSRVVKGGSWMDGPVDLRISNFKTVETTEKSNEVGFRLVKEVKE